MILRAGGIASATGALAATAALAEAQAPGSFRFDQASGKYFVTITTESRGPRELEVDPANGADASIRPRIEVIADGSWRFVYSIVTTSSSRQDLAELEIPCSRTFGAPSALSGTAYAADGRVAPLLAQAAQYRNRDVCVGARGFIRKGDSLSMTITLRAAPAFGTIHLIGKNDGVLWPDDALGLPANDRARAVVDSLGGISGGWRDIATVVPSRPLTSVDTPAGSLQAVASDLNAACGVLGLIANPGTCNSLRAKIDAARESLGRNNRQAASGQVSAFLHELDAARGGQVPETAYAILHALGLLLQAQLQ